MQTQLVKVKDLKNNSGQIEGLPKNPRILKDDKFIKLKKSLQDDPEMLQLREVIAYDNNGELVVICGNMRLRALKELGVKEVPTKILPKETSVDKLRAYTIKDNVAFGEHSWDDLANQWDLNQLEEWGLDVLNKDKDLDDNYTSKVDSPIYEIKENKPSINELFDTSVYDKLIEEIDKSEIQEEDKEFLRYAAKRHIVFNYAKIAEYYAHSSKEVQDLIENSALVIIDYEKAIEKGFVKLHDTLFELSEIDG